MVREEFPFFSTVLSTAYHPGQSWRSSWNKAINEKYLKQMEDRAKGLFMTGRNIWPIVIYRRPLIQENLSSF